MISREDIADLIADLLIAEGRGAARSAKEAAPEIKRKGKWGFHLREPFNKPYTSLVRKRVFLSEWEIKQILRQGGNELRVPESAILSPLAEEWLAEKGIKIVRG